VSRLLSKRCEVQEGRDIKASSGGVQMIDPARQAASAFWGWVGRPNVQRRHAGATLFGHRVRAASDSPMAVWYSTAPAAGAVDDPSVRPRALVVGRAFPLAPEPASADAALDEAATTRALRNLDGTFRLLLLRGETLIVATDILAAGAVYYGVVDGCLYFGTHLGLVLEMLPRPPQPNRLGVASLLLSYGQLFEETHLSGVKRLQAGQFLAAGWNPQRNEVSVLARSYGDLPEVLSAGRQAPADPRALGELLRASQLREKYDESTVLMLSGGNDSKALALTRPAALQTAVTYGTPDSLDVRRGRRLARRLGMKHSTVPYDEWSFDTYADLIVGLNAGCSGLQTAHNIVGFDFASKTHSRAVVGFADVLTGVHLRRNPRMDADGARSLLLVGRGRAVARAMPEETETINEHVARVFAQYSTLTPVQALVLMDLRFRQATWVSTMFDLCAWMLPLSYPFFYRPLMQALFQLPTEDVLGQRFYLRWLAGAEREHGVVPTRVDNLWERIVSRHYQWRNGRKPVARLFLPDVAVRTDPKISTRYAGVMQELDQLTVDSWRESVTDRKNTIPLFTIAAPIAAAFHRSAGAPS
jgi:hypothetical protein